MVPSMTRSRALNAAALSLLVAGAGQLLQGRRGVALWHLLEVAALGVMAGFDAPHGDAWWGAALAMNGWSVVDAYRHALRHPTHWPAAG